MLPPPPVSVARPAATPHLGAHVGPRWLRQTLIPLVLLTLCPPFVLVLWHVHTRLGGAISVFRPEMLLDVWRVHWAGSPTAWTLIGVFAAFQLLLLRVLPGARFEGPITPAGNVPTYPANGPAAFAVTLGTWALLTSTGVFPATILYDNLGDLFGSLNLLALGICLLLYLKGRHAPSSTDASVTGNPIFDYYWGTELHPRVLGWDVKQFTNCRFGMMAWPLLILSYAAAQDRAGGLSQGMIAAVAIQLVYVAKFFWWETGYLRSLDIMHDRAGFYICWGCLVWVPSVYTQSTLFLVDHPSNPGWAATLALFVFGVGAVSINYLADRQRQRVRATNGAEPVWGRPPVLLRARYVTSSGETRENLLLASGWWGLARHFHYVPEILGAVAWTAAVGFTHLLPWFYVVFLAILLTDRAFRDDARCAAKYGADWDHYRRLVPWRILPGIV